MELVLARFHTNGRRGDPRGGPAGAEAACLSARAFRSIRDDRLIFIRSRWRDEAAFERHAQGPHTVRFIEQVTR